MGVPLVFRPTTPPVEIIGVNELDSFEAFWDVYPRHDSKYRASKVWAEIAPSLEVQIAIHAALKWQVLEWKDSKFIPFAKTYLRDKRWMDDPPAWAISLSEALLDGEAFDRLLRRLDSVRLKTARELAVPPYVVFHDATLREMARLRPASLDDFRAVKGVGARKAYDLGERFLSVIRYDD